MSQWAGIRHLHLLFAGAAEAPTLGLGRPATAADIDAWGAIVGPEGAELPPGGATATAGRAVYDRRCAACHGPTGTEGPDDRLAGGRGSLTGRGQLLAGGHHAVGLRVPRDAFNQPGSLTTDEVYAAVAYVLFLNDLVGEDDRIDAAAHRDAEPGRVRARSAPGHRAAGDRARTPHRAAARRPHHHARHGRTDGEQHRRAVSRPRAGLGGESARALLPCTSPTSGAPTSWRARGTVLIVGSCCRSSETDSSVRAPAAPAGIRGV